MLQKPKQASRNLTQEIDKIKELQQRINIELQERSLRQPINDSGVFDQATREAIKRIQEARREPATGEIRPELNNEIGVQ